MADYKLPNSPWFPVALMLVVVFGTWLGIFGPLPDGFAGWLRQWQTLVASTVALIAAAVAFHNTTRTLRQGAELEATRRQRKHAALRAVLPLALSQVANYAEGSARALDKLVSLCLEQKFPHLPEKAAPESLIEPLPSDTLKTLTEFIEYSDTVDVRLLQDTIVWIQIHNSRVRRMVQSNHDPSSSRVVDSKEIMSHVVDAAKIYAAADAMILYSRRQEESLPRTVSWRQIESALVAMGLRNYQYSALILEMHRESVE
jgi:hypothetical protein